MRVLGLSGSLRHGSYNKMLLLAARALMPADVDLELFGELAELPPYNEDLDAEDGPVEVRRLRGAILAADALLIATPEYNGSIPGHLKTAIDWASRPTGAGALADKPAAVIGASTGSFGGLQPRTSCERSFALRARACCPMASPYRMPAAHLTTAGVSDGMA